MAAVDDLAECLRRERGLVLVVTGAGTSLASGIATFRGTDPGAVWKRDVTELATEDYFRRDPVGSWSWYEQRFRAAIGAAPNPAHHALAALERWQTGRGGAFLLVTQNIDTLHEQAGSNQLVKVHGSVDRVRCSRDGCALGAPAGSLLRRDVDLDSFRRAPGPDTLPRCPACGDILRQHVLWFDELYTSHADYGWTAVLGAVARMRLVLFVGTSFSVGVTDFICGAARGESTPAFSIDPNGPMAAVPAGVVQLTYKAEELLPQLVRTLA